MVRELIRQGHIPAGDVDTRSIRDVCATDLVRFTQCHFFAGIGGWSLALRLAGWPDDVPVWTGSCPCQPFSAAGKQMGTADSRHLWPAFRRLILHGAPPVVFGEQVASALGRQWLAGIRANLETMGYAVGAADLCAAGVGAPHIRQRLFWVADTDGGKSGNGELQRGRRHDEQSQDETALRLADVLQPGLEGYAGHGDDGHEPGRNGAQATGSITESGCVGDGLEHATLDGREQRRAESSGWSVVSGCGDGGMGNTEGDKQRRNSMSGTHRQGQSIGGSSGDSYWSDYDLIPCADGKARRIEPGTFPLAHGVPGRVGLLRGYGNAIVPQVAAQFIQAYLEAKGELSAP